MTEKEAIKTIVEDRIDEIMACPFIYECETDNCWSCGLDEAYAMALDALFREKNYDMKVVKRNELKKEGE